MKKLILILFALIFAISYLSFSQAGTTNGQSYMIPDIGGAGMNVYVEFIAHADSVGYFGDSGFYFGREDELAILPIDVADDYKIEFSAPVVSWDGRMMSAQAFINPELEPNNWFWEDLDDEFVVPIGVYKNDTLLGTYTFYIVEPDEIGDISNIFAEILGIAFLGRRSPRGAMLVDSLILNDFEYRVDTTDCDPNTPGNQGYLPFILLSKGPIRGSGPNSAINIQGIDATDDIPGHGAPGGGGGGGRVCDARAGGGSSFGSPGGKGFTGGGGGGRNTSGIPGEPLNYEPNGLATGEDGASLNGLLPGLQFTVGTAGAENAGGGTGHPFGASGVASSNTQRNAEGGYGGGSGYRRDWEGGSGGYASDGISNESSGGKVHGNRMLIPLAGGSGGASGNPESDFPFAGDDQCSGSGGGGGGAIRLAAPAIERISLYANGGLGGQGHVDSEGGSGSGGGVEINAKMNSQNIFVNIEGGNLSGRSRGGQGRVRIDRKDGTNFNFEPNTPTSNFRGPTSDTLTFPIDRIFTLQGTAEALNNNSIRAFIKPESGDWREVPQTEINVDVNNLDWSIDFDLSAENDLSYYFYLVQETNAESDAQYAAIPEYFFSQAAANVIQFAPGTPEIDGDSTLSLIAVECDGIIVQDTIFIHNEGLGPLDLELENATFQTGEGLSIEGIVGQEPVPIEDTVGIIIQYTYFPGHTGTVNDILFIPHNDNDDDENPWEVRIDITFDELFGEFYRSIGDTPADTIITGTCRDELISGEFRFRNLSNFDYFLDLESNIERLVFDFMSDSMASSNAYKTISYEYFNPDLDESIDTVFAIITGYAANCDQVVDEVVLMIIIYDSKYEITDANSIEITELDFGEVIVGQSSLLTMSFRNVGEISISIDDFAYNTPPFELIDAEPDLPNVLSPGESMEFTFSFTPTEEIDYSDEFRFLTSNFQSFCAADVRLDLLGRGIEPGIVVPPQVNFGFVNACEKDTMELLVYNDPDKTLSYSLVIEPPITGADAGNFRIIGSIPDGISYPYPMTPGDSLIYLVEFDATIGGAGVKNAQAEITTDIPGLGSLLVDLNGVSENADLTIDPNPIDLGDVGLNEVTPVTVTITNNGNIEQIISRLDANDPNMELVSPMIIIPPGESRDVNIEIRFTRPATYTEELAFIIDAPCFYSFATFVNANVLEAIPEYDTEIRIGPIPTCADSTMIFTLSNIGDFQYLVSEFALADDLDGIFEINELVSFPYTVEPQSSTEMIEIVFNNPGEEGTYETVVSFGQVANTFMDAINIPITIIVEDANLGINPDPIEFGTVIEQLTSTQRVTITNNGTWQVIITDMTLSNAVEFELNPEFDNDIILEPGEVYVFDVTINPNQPFVDYSESLSIDYTFAECIANRTIPINALSTDRKILHIVFPDLTDEPDIDNYQIPVQAIIEGVEDAEAMVRIDSVAVSFNRSLYFPTNAIPGTIIENYTKDNRRYVTVELSSNNYTFSSADTTEILRFVGYTMLGDIKSTDLKIENVGIDMNGAISDTVYNDGSLTIEICEEGGERLLSFGNPSSVRIDPNPPSESINISITSLELGFHEMELFNANGISLKKETWNNESVGSIREYKYSTSELESGLYIVILKSPSETKSKNIIIAK